ncbi:MAG: FtsX-like permease family protein, partial [Streptosporangiaceae bacterium]|nr:FtsX-like permease family protein [Streptosporangiaceae bacterium]
MSGHPVLRAARSGVTGRRVQAAVIGLVVGVSTAASALALGLIIDANAPFDHAFAAQQGAHATTTVDGSKATAAQLSATARLPQVAAAAGPFPETIVTAQVTIPGVLGSLHLPPVTLAGRASPGGPVDDIALDRGRWAQRPGEIVVSRDMPGPTLQVGQRITITGTRGTPSLTVVGIGKSITDSADGWVVPGEVAALRAPGASPAEQMLYRFRSAGSPGAVSSDVAAVRAALPPGSLLGSQSYLTVKLQATSSIAPWVPFIVAFALIGLVMSVLIVVNVVSGAVVAGYRRIGVLRSIGFTPGQVVAVYVWQVAVCAVAGCLGGVLLGNLLSVPLLGQTARVFGVGSLAIPVWVDVAVAAGMLALTGIAALLPALRAGRLSAVQAIATGRAPRPDHGYAAHRLLGRARLPRPLTVGLAAPFARPARTLVTLVAILLGATAATFAAGLSTSLDRAELDLSHSGSEPVQVDLGAGLVKAKLGAPRPPGTEEPAAVQQRAVEAALRAQPGTLRYVAEADAQVAVPGIPGGAWVRAFRGDASWTGYAVITGRWYHGPGEADVNTYFLTATGTSVGGTAAITSGGKRVMVRIVGEIFDPENGTASVLTDFRTLAGVLPGLTPRQYDVALRPGVNAGRYASALGPVLGQDLGVSLNGTDPLFVSLLALVSALTVLLMLVAGLGVLNTVVLTTRERAHDLGVFKAVGMTPRQTIAMVVSSVAGIGLVAG